MKPLRDYAYRKYLRFEGRCCACVKLGLWEGSCYGCDPAHTQNNGLQSKGPDSSCAPLCRKHHREYDRGRKAFEAKYQLDMRAEAEWWWLQYQSWKTKTGAYDPEVPF